MIVRKDLDGEYYICRIPSGSSSRTGKRGKKVYRNWFLIKGSIGRKKGTEFSAGYLNPVKITFPKEFIGKKIKLKVVILK